MAGQEQRYVYTGAERFKTFMHKLVNELDGKLYSMNRTLEVANKGQFSNANTFGQYILNLLHVTILDVREATCISVNDVTFKNEHKITNERILFTESYIIYNKFIVLVMSMVFCIFLINCLVV